MKNKANFPEETDEAILARAAVMGLPIQRPFDEEILRGYRRLADVAQRLAECELADTPASIFDPTR